MAVQARQPFAVTLRIPFINCKFKRGYRTKALLVTAIGSD
jgi:hypothetical protein